MADASADLTYDRSQTGWESKQETREFTMPDGSVIKYTGNREPRLRPEEEQVRCGPYKDPHDGTPSWGDHRVTYRGSTCEETDCHVAHHPDAYPGWTEPRENWYDRDGVKPVAAALYGWDAAGHLHDALGTTTAYVAAHVVLDALRDAGYEITRKPDIISPFEGK